MRCPKCRKKVHKDDIYCVWCSTSLRGRSPEDPWNCVCADDETHRRHTSRPNHRRTRFVHPGKFLLLILAMVSILFSATAFVFNMASDISIHASAPQPEPVIPEDAWKLGTVLAQWNGFTVTAEFVSMDNSAGEVQIICTSENQTGHTIFISDASVTAAGYHLPLVLYLELEPGETTRDILWVDTGVLPAVDVTHLQELTISLNLMDAENYTLLATTDPVTLDLDLPLPGIHARRSSTTLIETDDLTVTLVGYRPDREYGELTLCTLIENRSGEHASVLMEEGLCGKTDLRLYGYYDVPGNTKQLCRDILYDIPYSETSPTDLSFRIQTEDEQFQVTATGRTHIRLSPDGLSGEIRSEWE